MRVMVTGASGYIGSRLITELVAAGHDVVAASRKPDSLARFGWYADITPVALDASDRTSVATACAAVGPIDTLYYLVHGIGESGFREKDNAAARNVALAARDADVARIVYLGGFVPHTKRLSEHLASRAEVADHLAVAGGAELVWLRAAVILGAGSTSFELIRYVADRLPAIPLPAWADNTMDPISIRDAIYYLVAAAEPRVLPPGAYDIAGADTSTYRHVLFTYLSVLHRFRIPLPLRGFGTGLASVVSGALVPLPSRLAADLVASLDYPMHANDSTIRELVPDPLGGLLDIRAAMNRALSSPAPRPVNELADLHHLADTDPDWAGGDLTRIRETGEQIFTVRHWRRIERLGASLIMANGPAAGAIRTGIDVADGLIGVARSRWRR